MPPDPNSPEGHTLFRTTHWSVVLAAGGAVAPDAHAALAKLCQTYWYPLYAFVRRKGHPHEEAQDLTQAFFTRLLEKNQIAQADPNRGRFRTFLLHSFENFLHTEHRDATTQKRGGGREIISWDAHTAAERYAGEPADGASPATLFERHWVTVLLESVLGATRREFAASGREELFDHLEPHLWGDDLSTPYPRIGELLGMTTVAVRVTLHRLRRRFHDLLRSEVAHTVGGAEDVDEELRHLRRLLSG